MTSVSGLGLRGVSFRPGRSVLCIALVASATFVIVAVGSFRREGADIDFPDDPYLSPRHAELGFRDGRLYLRDLGSRNGTYVNGIRIDGRIHLDDGSRIRVGATIYLLSFMDDAGKEEDQIDSGTMAMEDLSFGNDVNEEILRVVDKKGRKGTDFAGQLGSFSVVEVLQLLISTRRSGTLHVALQTGHAKVEVRVGEVCTAHFQELDGFPALLMLVRQKSGIFWLQETTTPCRNTVQQPSNRLLFELCRALDEKQPVN